MGKNLVIVESPAKAKTIQKFLGDDFIVKSSFGHIRDLHNNTLSVDVDNKFKPEYIVPEDKKKVVEELTAAAAKAETVWLASDEDREGEAIAWHLKETLGLDDSNTKRIAFHEITKNAITTAVANPREVDMNLVNAQQARRILDRLVGFELSPILWKRIQPKLSAGRVQSVALRLVVDKEREIQSFTPEQYYKVEAIFIKEGSKTGFKAVLNRKFQTIQEAEDFLSRAASADWHIDHIETKDATKSPSAPFTTSTLQQEAARKLRFSVKQTMSIAQKLYEEGLITYMRTDSTNLSALAIGSARNYILDTFGEQYSKTRQYKTKAKGAQEAHEAIRPTYPERDSIDGNANDKKLYRLIWERTIASQMSDAKLARTDVTITADGIEEHFSLQASQILFDGFLKLYMDSKDDDNQDDDEETIMPKVNVGDTLGYKTIKAEAKYTSAPSRYSEATLVKRLEELGIGRPSTYAPTISTLTTERGYIYKGDITGRTVPVTDLILENGTVTQKQGTISIGTEKGRLIPHNVGVVVTDYLVKGFEKIMDYGFTAEVEKDFDKIAEGELVWNEVIGEFYTSFHEKIKSSPTPDPVSREVGTDGDIKYFAKFGKYGAYIERVGSDGKSEYASLGDGLLIEEVSLGQAKSLFAFPRLVGSGKDGEIYIHKGPYGPYIKYNGSNLPLPKGTDPLKVTLEETIHIIDEALSKKAGPIAVFEEEDIQILSGKYGPYIKHAGNNYKIPKGVDAQSLTLEECKEILANTEHTKKKSRKR